MARRGRAATRGKETEFFLNFLEESEKQREEYRHIDREVLENYMVLPPGGADSYRTSISGNSYLADTETHQMVETLLAKLMLGTVGERGYIQAEPVGREDARAGRAVSRLMEGVYRFRTNRRAKYVQLKDTLLFGAGLIAPAWRFETTRKMRRVFEIDPFSGQEFGVPVEVEESVWDNVEMRPVDLDDFFQDPSRDMIENMLGGAMRFIIPAHRAMAMTEGDNPRWEKGAVKRAIAHSSSRDSAHSGVHGIRAERDDEWRDNVDRPQHRDMIRAWKPLVGYTGWFEVPYKTKDGTQRRRMTLLNGELVESRPKVEPIGRLIPVYEAVVNPILGRWRGVAPGAVARFTQDFLNALLMLTSDAVVKKVRSPVLYQKGAGIDLEKLEEWRGPIGIRGVNNIRELDYDPPLQEAFALMSQLKSQQREGSSALSLLQGLSPSQQIRSATEASGRFANATDRPNMMQLLLEEEYFPAEGLGVFELLQFFIADSQDLANRIGVSEVQRIGGMPFIEEIQGQWDIRFVGSSRVQNKQVKIEFIERASQVWGSNPAVAAQVPWAELMVAWLEAADLREIEEMVANPERIDQFVDLQSRLGQQGIGNANNAGVQLGAGGLLPAQAAGRAG